MPGRDAAATLRHERGGRDLVAVGDAAPPLRVLVQGIAREGHEPRQGDGADPAHQPPGSAARLPPDKDGPQVGRAGGGEPVEHRGEPAGQARQLVRRHGHAGPRSVGG